MPDGVATLFQDTVREFGTVDILVNNAGILIPKPFLGLTKLEILTVLETNLIGTILCAQSAAKIMLANNFGTIINIASISCLNGFGTADNLHYALSKGGIAQLTGILAKELGPSIRVNAVAPGFVDTDMPSSPGYAKRAIKESVIKRLIKPGEIAKVCLFLASDDASALTGEVIFAYGGFKLK